MRKYTNSEIKARLIFVIGCALSLTFMLAVCSLLYGLLFVVQPLEVSPNDESAWAILNPLVMTLVGALGGLLAGNGLKDKEQRDDQQ